MPLNEVTEEKTGHEPLCQLKGIGHQFHLPGGRDLSVLSEIDFTVKAGELVAILGPSGCGKSTLIRIVAGLLQPSQGEFLYRGQPTTGPNPHVSLVFQHFALYPWLTISQNIEQALVPRGIDPEARKKRVAEVISLIGLEGFEEAYPRELSGGMKQRVGIARALAVSPELLCMDEPFSQVDPLTAESLRNEVINLWRDREKYPLSIFFVTHDIHEVAFMASKIFIMSANPGRVKMVLENTLPYPRDRHTQAFLSFVDKIHDAITGIYLPEEEGAPVAAAAGPIDTFLTISPIPLVEVREIVSLLEMVSQRGDYVDLFNLTTEMDTTFTRALLAVKGAELLGFLETPQDRLVITDLGNRFLQSTRKGRKQIFQVQLRQVPLIRRLKAMLDQNPQISKEILLEELAIQCPQEDPKRLFRVLVNWGQFAELWTYQAATATLMNL
jgi:NitT/TauT family transport system ATP-binding protein